MENTNQELKNQEVVEEVAAEEVPNVDLQTRLDAMIEENKRLEAETIAVKEENAKAFIEQELNQRQLTPFKSIFEVFKPKDDALEILQQVDVIEQAVNQILAMRSYQPKEVAKQEAYEQALNAGDVKSAINFKLGKFFGK